MKKLLPFLIAFIFCEAAKAQAPVLTYTNVTGSNSITCAHPSINYIASVSNYTNGSLTYTWVSLSGTGSGTAITISNPSQYTLTAFDPVNSFSLSQVFSVGINTITPASTVTPLSQNINCSVGSSATFTGITTSTMTNVTHSWLSPFCSSPAISNGTISIFNVTAPGTYTYCVTNNINGCNICKTVTVSSTGSFPSFNITSPQQFTLGCGATSLTAIQISNVVTNPMPGGPVSFTVLPPSYTGPSYNLGLAASYTANTPGQYTVIVHDITNGCESKVPVSVISKTFQPQISSSTNQPTLTCYVPHTLLQGSSTNTNVSFSWAFPGPPAGQFPNDTLTAFTTTNTTNTVVATYTLTVTDNINLCKSTQTLTVYQNIFSPNAIITGSNVISCNTPSLILTNASTSNIPPSFFPTMPVIGLAWYGPVPQASLANSSTYIAYTPGTYSLIAQDLNNGCKAITTKTVANNSIYPQVSSPLPFNINCPTPTATIFPVVTGTTTGFTYSWTAPASASVSNYTQPTITVNAPGAYTVNVTNPANGCSSFTIVNVGVCVNIEQNSNKNNISVFPNPNNGSFVITTKDPLTNAEAIIFNVLGSKIRTQKIAGEKNEINIHDQPNGIYFVHLTDNNKTETIFKILKQ